MNIENRVLLVANYILQTKSTVRRAAKVFGVSKSTIHYDVSYRLKKINYSLYIKINKILQQNFKEKHIRGGEATKNKYKIKRGK
ncbi:MAG: sporulation transcriptional regulator SpoIIID [Clostridia bacterium]|nr:sporulation transcriptional regulator SpoIIID [Clostridia bacterium]